jgi:RNA polymerase sigma-70 factor (ECF subfamily)
MSIALQPSMMAEVFALDTAGTSTQGELKAADDAKLVSMAQTGDFSAFEELVRRYRNDVFGLANHFLRNREEAWDISQEVFIKAHQALGSFRGDASFKTWLLRITANRCKDFFKKRRLDTVSFNDALKAEDHPSADLDPSRSLEASEVGHAIQTALEQLPAKHRTAFVLREFEGLSYEEMSKVMHCNLGTVMSRLHHARKKLQHMLTSMGVVEGN